MKSPKNAQFRNINVNRSETTKELILSNASKASRYRLLALLGLIVTGSSQAFGLDSTWTATAGGNWSDTTSWFLGNVASGVGATADFSTVDVPTSGITVHLNSSYTVGNLTFGDTVPSTAGTWTIDNNGSASNILTLSTSSGSPTITVANSGNATISAVIAGASGLTKMGSGTLTLTAANTYTGASTISQGSVLINNANALGADTGAIVMNGGTLSVTATGLVINKAINVAQASSITLPSGVSNTTLAGAITGAAALNVSLPVGSQILNLGNGGSTNSLASFSGTLNLGSSLGKVRLNYTTGGTYGSSSAYFNLGTGYSWLLNRNGGTFMLGALTGGANTTLSGAGSVVAASTYSIGGNNASTTFAGKIVNGDAGSGTAITAITKVGSGTLTLTGINTYTGATTVEAGTLLFGGTNSLPSASALTVKSGATVAVSAGNTWTAANIGTLLNTGTFNAGSIIGIDTSVADFTYNAIADTSYGSLGLTKLGSNALTLTGVNTYTGATTISSGTLNLVGSLGNTAVNVSAGAILMGTGTANGVTVANGNISGSLTFNNDVTVSTGVTAAAAAFNGNVSNNGTITSAFTLQSGKTLAGSGTASGAVAVVGGTVNGSGLTLGNVTFSGSSGLSGLTTAANYTIASGTTFQTGTAKGAVSVLMGATLNHSGLINGNTTVGGLLKTSGTVAGTLSLTSGTLAPGNGMGIATISGNLTMDNKSTLAMEVTGTAAAGSDYDQVKVSGAVSLDGVLSLTSLSGLTMGDKITLILNTSNTANAVSGTFSAIEVGGITQTVTNNFFTYNNQEYEISYNVNGDATGVANDVVLTAVPEPSVWAMHIGGLCMLAAVQRLRRRRH